MPLSPKYRYHHTAGRYRVVCFLVLFFLFFAREIPAQELEAEWGGHIQLRAESAWPDSHATIAVSGTDPLVDGSADFRLKNQVFLGDSADLETHYEFITLGGDTRKQAAALAGGLVPASFLTALTTVNDRRRLFDLTALVDEATGHVAYHRLDRLALALRGTRGTLTLGRQALTWGNGLVFNPMDLFNPFSPTDTDRDYKIGDDMALVRMPDSPAGDLQFLYVPRRSLVSEDVDWDESSMAAKLHRAVGTTEFDAMAAQHCRDYVFGLGASGYILDAAWRTDITWTRLYGTDRIDYLALVANLDYSWIWGGKNWYGLVEFFYNGLGHDDPAAALADADLIRRIDRGELFSLGKTYLATQLQYEIHPLVNLHLAAMANLHGPSGILQPRAVWDWAQDIQVILGGSIYWGRQDTEFGGFQPVAGGPWIHSSDSAYLRLSYYF